MEERKFVIGDDQELIARGKQIWEDAKKAPLENKTDGKDVVGEGNPRLIARYLAFSAKSCEWPGQILNGLFGIFRHLCSPAADQVQARLDKIGDKHDDGRYWDHAFWMIAFCEDNWPVIQADWLRRQAEENKKREANAAKCREYNEKYIRYIVKPSRLTGEYYASRVCTEKKTDAEVNDLIAESHDRKLYKTREEAEQACKEAEETESNPRMIGARIDTYVGHAIKDPHNAKFREDNIVKLKKMMGRNKDADVAIEKSLVYINAFVEYYTTLEAINPELEPANSCSGPSHDDNTPFEDDLD